VRPKNRLVGQDDGNPAIHRALSEAFGAWASEAIASAEFAIDRLDFGQLNDGVGMGVDDLQVPC
jgi:hypothetical protein